MNNPQPAPSEALVAPLGVVHPAPGAALLVPSKKIKVNGTTSEAYVREKPAFHRTVMQSLAFDNVNKRIFIAQVIEHEVKLDDEPATVPWALRDKNGDLTITMWQWNANLATPAYQFGGRMFLRGYGHGVSIGVEPVGTDSYLWTEVDSIPYPLPNRPDRWSGRGQNICRFKFRDTAAPQGNASGHLQKHTPVPGSTYNSVNIDPVYGRLIHRFRLASGPMRYRVHDLDLARMGVWDAYLADVEEPEVKFLTKYGAPDFQGYASVGRYLYLLHGNAYGPDGSTSPPGEGNTHITSVNLTTGDVDYTAHTRAGFTLDHREPEGLAIQVPDITQPEVFRVAMGFAGGPDTGRNVSIYHKPELIAG